MKNILKKNGRGERYFSKIEFQCHLKKIKKKERQQKYSRFKEAKEI